MTLRLFGGTICVRRLKSRLALAIVLILCSGCANEIIVPKIQAPPLEHRTGPILADTVQPISTLAAAEGSDTPEEPFDPFATSSELGFQEYDPLEPLNTKVFEFNRQVDRWVLKPVATGYDYIMPNPVQIGVSNFFYNARFVPRFVNNVLQGKLRGAGIEVGRFLVNTTVGLAGFIDWASEMDLKTPEEDFGQTLGFYGINPGPYLVVPLLQPYTVRDLTGYVVDIFLNPIHWLVLPIIEIDAIPSVIPHKNRVTTSLILFTAKVTEVVNDRSLNLEEFQGVEEATLDLYSAVRNAYLQKRAKAIQE